MNDIKPDLLPVICAVVDTRNLALYKEDGSTLLIPQGDHRVQRILDAHMATWNAGKTAYVDLSHENHYTGVEEKSNGFIKFFKVAKAKVAEFFQAAEAAHVKPIKVGRIPMLVVKVTTKATEEKPAEVVFDNASVPATKQEAAVTEIMKHAVSVTSGKFTEPTEGDKDTMIAVVNGKVIPGVEKLKPQFAAAGSKLGSTVGVEAFMARLASVMDKRRHSVEDLMKFMERGDLPIADDGCIVIYKILKNKHGEPGTFVDCHSGNVPQKVGSRVFMDESMVDPDRRNDCSNGLHVARRGYLNNFSGDVCVIAKVRPEDVIAVPQYDSNKMRVCGYHILALLKAEDFSKLRSNKPITDTESGQKLLGNVLAGRHVGITELVKIGGQRGTNITITPVGTKHAEKAAEAKAAPRMAQAINADANGADGAPAVDAKAVVASVAALNMPAVAGVVLSKRQVQAQAYYSDMLNAGDQTMKIGAAQTLLAYKKTAKVSWDKLGLSDETGALVSKVAGEADVVAKTLFTDDPAKAVKLKVAKPAVKAATTMDMNSGELTLAPMSLLQALLFKAKAGDRQAAVELKALQKAKKKGWVKLGLPANTGEVLADLLK